MIVVPTWSWQIVEPVAASDTIDNIGGTFGRKAVAVHNRSASSMVVSFTTDDGRTRFVRILAGEAISGCGRWKRVNSTGTTGSGSSVQAYELIKTTAVGLAFGNQPANDGVEIVSSDAADTTQSITIYGTTQATDTVVVETVALNGTTAVATTKLDWGVILAVELSASCAGTVTVREASANQTITTLTTGVLSKGVETVTGSVPTTPPTVVASGATTKQIGLYGTSLAGVTQGDSQALNGTTPVAMNLSFGSVTKVLTGDLENTVTVTVSVSADLAGLY